LVIQSFEYIALRHDISSYRPWPEFTGDVRLLGTMLSTLYAFELLYRPTMKPHAIAYLIRRLEEDRLPIYKEVGLLWLFQGTTEQITLIGAIGLRTGWNPQTVSKILHFAAFQTGLINWTERGNLMWVFALGLIWTQFRSSPISLARRLKRQSVNSSSSPSTSSAIAAPILATLQVALEEVEKSIDAKMDVVGTTGGNDTEVVL
ncbi:hypothetical protein HD553DRAFT_359189, partial [Filobasidium floriforme]|uniref:uncharacterized protein n=1 Tax=Filobasidium floriforme TaxID=5210 RepID=UPI001E8CA179